MKDGEVGGPFLSFNSTHARFDLASDRSNDVSQPSSSHDNPATSGMGFEWRARDNRKGRHRLVISPHYSPGNQDQPSSSVISVLKNILRMFTVLAYWDVSWWIAVFFTIGCALFIVTGVVKVAPLNIDSGKEEAVGGIAACIGATLFAFAGVLLDVEATNENQTGCFGWAIDRTYDQTLKGSGSDDAVDYGNGRTNQPAERHSGNDDASLRVQRVECQHLHHSGLRYLHQQHPDAIRSWAWWPSWHELTTHYFHDLGFLGSLILSVGTIIFWVSGLLSLPSLSERLSPTTMKWTYWLAFLVGGFHFAAASILYMLESQRKWYWPNLRSLSWWIGLFDLIGSVGWMLSAVLGGYCGKEWCTSQSDIALLWASVAFETGSLLLWYEAVEKYPVEVAE